MCCLKKGYNSNYLNYFSVSPFWGFINPRVHFTYGFRVLFLFCFDVLFFVCLLFLKSNQHFISIALDILLQQCRLYVIENEMLGKKSLIPKSVVA